MLESTHHWLFYYVFWAENVLLLNIRNALNHFVAASANGELVGVGAHALLVLVCRSSSHQRVVARELMLLLLICFVAAAAGAYYVLVKQTVSKQIFVANESENKCLYSRLTRRSSHRQSCNAHSSRSSCSKSRQPPHRRRPRISCAAFRPFRRRLARVSSAICRHEPRAPMVRRQPSTQQAASSSAAVPPLSTTQKRPS